MKNIKDIQKEISDLHAEIKQLEKSRDKTDIVLRKRLMAKLPQLEQFIAYLKTNPTEEYCKKEAARLINRINEISKQYIEPQNIERLTKGQSSAMKKAFEEKWGLPVIRKQLLAINYILK
jgi:cell division septum initiation protein DivIVA